MSEALKIMDDVERKDRTSADFLERGIQPITKVEWLSLRAALERQADQIALQYQRHTECAKNLVNAWEQLAQKDARIARLERGLAACYRHAADDDNFTGVNEWEAAYPEWVDYEPWEIAREVLNESEPQSAAHLKAEALREAMPEPKAVPLTDCDPFEKGKLCGWNACRQEMEHRIEREAKEES